MSATYDWHSYGDVWAQEWRRTVRTLAPVNQALVAAALAAAGAKGARTILDVGCGAGTTSFALADALPEARITGVDLSPALVAVAWERAEGRGGLAELGPHPGEVDPRVAAQAALQDGAQLGHPVREHPGRPVRLRGPVPKVLLGGLRGPPLPGGPLRLAGLGRRRLQPFEPLGVLDAGCAGTGQDLPPRTIAYRSP